MTVQNLYRCSRGHGYLSLIKNIFPVSCVRHICHPLQPQYISVPIEITLAMSPKIRPAFSAADQPSNPEPAAAALLVLAAGVVDCVVVSSVVVPPVEVSLVEVSLVEVLGSLFGLGMLGRH